MSALWPDTRGDLTRSTVRLRKLLQNRSLGQRGEALALQGRLVVGQPVTSGRGCCGPRARRGPTRRPQPAGPCRRRHAPDGERWPQKTMPCSNAAPLRGAPRLAARYQFDRSTRWFSKNSDQQMNCGQESWMATGQSSTGRSRVLALPVFGERSYESYSKFP